MLYNNAPFMRGWSEEETIKFKDNVPICFSCKTENPISDKLFVITEKTTTPVKMYSCTSVEVSAWLTRLIYEVRKANGRYVNKGPNAFIQ